MITFAQRLTGMSAKTNRIYQRISHFILFFYFKSKMKYFFLLLNTHCNILQFDIFAEKAVIPHYVFMSF